MLTHAIIPAAGLATRFLPASKSIPKEMFPLYDKPVIQFVVEESLQAGMENVIFVTSAGKDAILDYFDKINPRFNPDALADEIRAPALASGAMIDVASIRQKEAKGLGHAVLTGCKLVGNAPFAVLLPDMMLYSINNASIMERMAEIYRREKVSVIALMKVAPQDVGKYGIAEGTVQGDLVEIKRMIEKPSRDETDSNLAIVGRYIFTPAIIDILQHTEPGRKNEIQLTDAMNELNKKERCIGLVLQESDLVFDAGDKAGYALANAFVASRHIPGFKDLLNQVWEKLS